MQVMLTLNTFQRVEWIESDGENYLMGDNEKRQSHGDVPSPCDLSLKMYVLDCYVYT